MRTRSGNKEQNILNAAIRVFAESGYHNAKISKIAEVAGVATGSVYLYFRNKENILFKIFDNVWQQLSGELQQLVNRTDLSPVEKLEGMIDLIFDKFTDNTDLAIVFVNEQSHLIRRNREDFTLYYERFLDLGEQVVREGMSGGVFNPNVDTKIFRAFVFGGIRHLIHQWADDPRTYPLHTVRQSVKLLIKKGILNA